jgi:hypothetical protein
MSIAPSAAKAETDQKIVRGILVLLQQLVNEKAHGQVTITVRDGQISLADVRRTYLPQDLLKG